jgi:hypothetical protein
MLKAWDEGLLALDVDGHPYSAISWAPLMTPP